MRYASTEQVIIGSGNGLASEWHQGITSTNAELLGTNFNNISFYQIATLFIPEIAYEYVVCKMYAILSRPLSDNEN